MVREKGQGTGPFPVTTPTGATHYRVAVTMADGRRVWRTRPTKRLAEQARRQLVEARDLDLDPTRQTLAGYLRSWLAGLRDAKHQRVRPRTYDHYRLVVERHIIPGLDPEGKVPLARVTGRKVQAWLDADQAAPRTVRHHHAVLRRALNVAVRQRLLAYNSAGAVELPGVPGDSARPLSLGEARTLLAATADDRLGILWRLALVTGLRQGELLGLTWADVSPGALLVRAQLQRLSPGRGGDARGWARTPTKAARTVTTVPLDAETARLLEAHRVSQASERQADWPYWGMVFVTPAGMPYHRREVLTEWKAACVKAGLEPRRFHDARHTYAHQLEEQGTSEDVRMGLMGHTTTKMARRYAGSSDEQARAAVERLAGRLEGAG